MLGLASAFGPCESSVGTTRAHCVRERRKPSSIRPIPAYPSSGYVGSILVWGGSRLAVNWLVAAATVFVLLVVYVYRISAEEQMLLEHLGDPYRSYKARTWRLLPFVW